MALTLSKIANNTATVTLQFGEDSVNVIYYPGRVTEKVFAQMEGFENTDTGNVIDGFKTLNEVLVGKPKTDTEPEKLGLIKSWDVFENDGVTMFPLDHARLSDLPIFFRMQMIYGILGDIRPEMLAPQTQTQN